MKILHQVGHNQKWNLESFFQNKIGDGFIFCAFSFDKEQIGAKMSGYVPSQYIPVSLLDLQYYGYKESKDRGRLNSYEFHPANNQTGTLLTDADPIFKAIEYQLSLGLKKIIIPNRCWPQTESDSALKFVNIINEYLIMKRMPGIEYYLTVPFTDSEIKNQEWIEKLLTTLTHKDMIYTGYYIACEEVSGYKNKISINFDYYTNLTRIFTVLKKQGFKLIHAYANWNSLVFSALVDIDYVTIGSFENLRKFSIKRFTEDGGGGPSQGWYYSEKLLNMIRSQELVKLRRSNCLDIIRNEKNIFSDIILEEAYPWIDNGNIKPDVHKNYLLAVSRDLQQISSLKDRKARVNYLLVRIFKAKEIYKNFSEKKIYLDEESSDYHLSAWENFLKPYLD